MAQNFTSPDPLRTGQITLSIYITELQDCVNEKRLELSQVDLTFINQKVGKIMRLDAIEELKVRINQLALDFGFSGGVTNFNLLGRDYINHPKIGGKPAAGFPIINDLRRVLEALVIREAFIKGIYANDWVNNPSPAELVSPTFAIWPLASEADFWNSIPLVANVGGDLCNIGENIPNDCDSTTGNNPSVIRVTNRNIIISGNSSGKYPGPYFLPPAGSINGDDIEHGYSKLGPLGIGITRRMELRRVKRYIPLDPIHNPFIVVGDFQLLGVQEPTNLTVGKTSVLWYSRGVSQGPDVMHPPRYGIQSKTGVTLFPDTVIPNQDIHNISSHIGLKNVRWWVGNYQWGGDGWYAPYQETGWTFVTDIFGAGTVFAGSGILKITTSGGVTIQDVRTASAPFVGFSNVGNVSVHHSQASPSDWRFMPAISTPAFNIKASGNYWGSRNIINDGNDNLIPDPTPGSGAGGINGIILLDSTDWRGKILAAPAPFRGSWTSENDWALFSDSEPEQFAKDFDSTPTRDLINNTLNYTVSYDTDMFRYNIEAKQENESDFVTIDTVEVIELFDNGGTVTNDSNPIVSSAFNYNVRLAKQTGQGLLIGPESFFPTIIPTKLPIGSNFNANSTINVGEIATTQDSIGLDIAAHSFRIFYQRNLSPIINNILVTTFNALITGLDSGEVYDIWVGPINDAGNGLVSNKIQVTPL